MGNQVFDVADFRRRKHNYETKKLRDSVNATGPEIGVYQSWPEAGSGNVIYTLHEVGFVEGDSRHFESVNKRAPVITDLLRATDTRLRAILQNPQPYFQSTLRDDRAHHIEAALVATHRIFQQVCAARYSPSEDIGPKMSLFQLVVVSPSADMTQIHRCSVHRMNELLHEYRRWRRPGGAGAGIQREQGASGSDRTLVLVCKGRKVIYTSETRIGMHVPSSSSTGGFYNWLFGTSDVLEISPGGVSDDDRLSPPRRHSPFLEIFRPVESDAEVAATKSQKLRDFHETIFCKGRSLRDHKKFRAYAMTMTWNKYADFLEQRIDVVAPSLRQTFFKHDFDSSVPGLLCGVRNAIEHLMDTQNEAARREINEWLQGYRDGKFEHVTRFRFRDEQTAKYSFFFQRLMCEDRDHQISLLHDAEDLDVDYDKKFCTSSACAELGLDDYGSSKLHRAVGVPRLDEALPTWRKLSNWDKYEKESQIVESINAAMCPQNVNKLLREGSQLLHEWRDKSGWRARRWAEYFCSELMQIGQEADWDYERGDWADERKQVYRFHEVYDDIDWRFCRASAE
ncbi:unnamed protein product [Amoebophrya sp. A120]|nr:unnamed protein product [Amoebophrya sp. A120]|eukprot:GSA120T00003400001.1